MGFETRGDCPACHVEGARVESWEGDAPGAPSAAQCRVCGHASAAGVETSPSRVPATPPDLERALAAWARAEGFASAEELVESSFVLATPAAILEALERGEPVETTFDVVDFLFSSGHGQGGAPAVDVREAPPEPRAPAGNPPPRLATYEAPAPAWSAPAPASSRSLGGPRDELLALAAVAASDGEASAEDLALLAQAAEARGVPPLGPEEIRVWRPAEIAPPPTLDQRERLLSEMFHLAWSDEQLDESEVRVVRAFARAWGVDPQRVSEWTDAATFEGKSSIARWIDRVGYFLFPGW